MKSVMLVTGAGQISMALARNMAWMLKLKEAGEKAGVELPKQEENRVATNFIR